VFIKAFSFITAPSFNIEIKIGNRAPFVICAVKHQEIAQTNTIGHDHEKMLKTKNIKQAVCATCQSITAATMQNRNVPVSDGSVVIQNILV
jgi:hypothetical protein